MSNPDVSRLSGSSSEVARVRKRNPVVERLSNSNLEVTTKLK